MIKLRPYQNEAIDAFKDFVDEEQGSRGIVVLPTGCISGEAVIQVHRAGGTRKMTLENLVHKFNGGRAGKNGTGKKWREDIQTFVRSMNAEGVFVLHRVASATSSGVKEVFNVETTKGKKIEATADHRFMTTAGWYKLRDLRRGDTLLVDDGRKPQVRKSKTWYRLVNGLRSHPYAARRGINPAKGGWSIAQHRLVAEADLNGIEYNQYIQVLRDGVVDGLRFINPETHAVHHIDNNEHNNDISNLQVLTHSDHHKVHGSDGGKWKNVTARASREEISLITSARAKNTYDLTMESEPHNFLVNGFVVHNCGKTVFGLALAKHMGARTLWLAHREELITQPIKALKTVWPEVRHGVMKAERNEWARDFVFASVQTAWRENRRDKLKGFDLVVVDECHRSSAESYKLILESAGCFSDGGPPLLGLTATPERSDNLRLDDVFQKIVYQFQLRTAVEAGYLVDVDMVQRPIDVDLDSVGSVGGDLDGGELDVVLLEAGIVREVCDAVDELARSKKTIIFTVSVHQATLIADSLREKGYRAAHISGKTPKDERREILKDFSTGKLTHVVNVFVLAEGFDEPTVECIVMARPTKSKTLYVQAVGRGLRISPGKDRCLIVDMVGVTRRHTLIQAPAIFGIEDEGPVVREESTEEFSTAGMLERMKSQIKGVSSLSRSRMKWVHVKEGSYAMGCGDGGNLIMKKKGEGWQVYVVGRSGSSGIEYLTKAQVDLELAQGIAEDYVRRSAAVYLTSKSASWRSYPATESQKDALTKWKIHVPDGLTKGEASDLMTAASAGSWKNDPATPKQVGALKRMGVEFDERSITKSQAGKMLYMGRR